MKRPAEILDDSHDLLRYQASLAIIGIRRRRLARLFEKLTRAAGKRKLPPGWTHAKPEPDAPFLVSPFLMALDETFE